MNRLSCGIFLLFLLSCNVIGQFLEADHVVNLAKLPDNAQSLLHLRFEENNLFKDEGDSGIAGINGTIEPVKGYKGAGAKFDGTNSAVNIPSHPSLKGITEGPVTIDFRLYMDKLPEKGEIGIIGFAAAPFTIFTNPNGSLYAYLTTEEQPWHIAAAGGLTIKPGQWHHVRFSYDGKSKISWFLDGATCADETSTKGRIKISNGDYAMVIGRYNTNYFEGIIDELWIATGFEVMTLEDENEICDKSLVFYAPFDGNPDAVVAAGQKKPLYYDESVRYEKGIKGQAILLKGEGIAYATAENFKREKGTIMFWFKGLDPMDVTAKRHAKQKMFYEMGVYNESMRLYWPGNGMAALNFEFICMGGVENGKPLTCGFFQPEDKWVSPARWYHIAITWRNGQQAEFYFDGNLIFTLPGINLPAELSDDFVMGRGVPELQMDELRIYGEPIAGRLIRKIFDEVDVERRKNLASAAARTTVSKTEASFKPELTGEPWYDNKLGEDDYVPPPWEPVKVKGAEVSTWGATYSCEGILPARVNMRDGCDLLTRPISLEMETQEGKQIDLSYGKMTVAEQGKGFCTLANTATANPVSIKSTQKIEFDGFIRTDLEVEIKEKLPVGKIWLEIPLKREHAKYYNICGTWPSYLTVPSGRIPEAGMQSCFEPYVWVGDEDSGFTFCAESNWDWINHDADRVIELAYEKETLVIRINLCDEKTEFKPGRKLTYAFGFMATPSRPFIPGRRLLRLGGLPPDVLRLGGLPPDGKRRGLSKDNIYLYWDWVSWSAPGMSFYPSTPDTFNQWQKRQSDLSNMFKKAYFTPYMNFQKFGYQVKGGVEKEWYIKYKEVMALFPYKWNNWPEGEDGWSKTFNFCPNSKSFCDFFVWSFNRFLEQAPAVNGVYIDETFTYYCLSDKHGCRGKNIFGDDSGKYPIFAHRELIKRIYKVAKRKNPDFIFFTHDSQFLKPPQRSFSDISTGGEPIHFPTTDPLDSLPLDRIMAEFLGRQSGVVSLYLPGVTKCKKHPDAKLCSERLLHLLFLHDVQFLGIWIHGNAPEDIWDACNRYGLDDSAQFIPYWEIEQGKHKEVSIDENSGVKVSVYKLANKNLIITVYNTGNAAYKGKIGIDWTALGDAAYGKGLAEVISGKGAVKGIDKTGLEIEIEAKDGMNIGVKKKP